MNKSEAGRLGALKRNKMYGNPMLDPVAAKKTGYSSGKAGIASHKNGRMAKGQASMMGKLSRIHENKVASNLPYKEVFLPQEICDRITIKDGKILFIEIKQKGQILSEKQEKFRSLVGNNYRI